MLVFLLLFALATRLPWIISNTMLFGFDHGRDALTVFNIIKNLNPVFVGPPTSIPGLFVGPGWYYFLTLAYWLGQGNPISSAYLMFLLYIVAIVLAYKYLGFYEAVILTVAPIWTQLSTGAQSPYPVPMITLLIVILLQKIVRAKNIPRRMIIFLGLLLGLGFNFSSAGTLFYLILIPLILIWRRKKLNWLDFGGSIFITFIPQILFELKHRFSQTQALIAYFAKGESQHISLGKISTVNHSIINELALAILPDTLWLKIIGLAILTIGIIYLVKQKKFGFWPEILVLIFVPVVGFWFLHYNVWYAYGLLPLAVIATGKILRSLPKSLASLFLILLIINSVIKLYGFTFQERDFLKHHKGFLPAKMQTLNYIYNQAGNQPFASFQYHPEIYDYAYQYLYIWKAFKGKPLPVEFSYQPGAPTYINEKVDFLAKLPQSTNKAEKIFLIIEKPENVWHYPFQRWLDNIKYSEVVSKKEFGPELEVWQVKP
ncbi:hypothetical protein KKF25_03635 [Patescibacteria group bacterium]|nr:hypothetical protein [Patescibacteria group bacterium]